jgi:hypothetical protein
MATQREPRPSRHWQKAPGFLDHMIEVYLPVDPRPIFLGIVQDGDALEAWLERIPERISVLAIDRLRGVVARERIACRRDGRVHYRAFWITPFADIPKSHEPAERN